MAFFHQTMLKLLIAVLGDPIMAGIAVTARILTIFCDLQTVERISMQLTRALFGYDHEGSSFLILLRLPRRLPK